MSFPLHCLRNGLAAIVLTASAIAAPFVAPTEENPPFRRDLLPIDADSMAALSRDFDVLATSISLETPAARRSVAQALALALALDPGNTSARENLTTVSSGKPPAAPDTERLTLARSRVWQFFAWLSTPEAGAHGKLLADLMGDAACVLDTGNPLATTLGQSPEAGKWEGWVAPLSEFHEVKKAVVMKNTHTDPFADIPPDIPKAGNPKILLEKAKLTTVLYDFDKASGLWILRPTVISLNASPENEDGTFQVKIPGASGNKNNNVTQILEALEKHNGMLPKAGSVEILTGMSGRSSYRRSHSTITGPGFLLANAALTGQEPEATVLVSLDEKHQPILPEYFWKHLSELRKGNGGRLVLPNGAEEYLTALLTLEEPEFFLKYEVLIASSPAEFIELCAKKPSEKHAAIFAKFAEIKAKADGGSTGTYLANRFVRQRLEEISAEAPYHLSSRLLAIQGAGERPRALTRKVLAAEIWNAVDPIRELVVFDNRMADLSSIARMDLLYEKARTGVDNLDRYTDIRDRDLLEQGKALAATVRTFSRSLRSRSNDDAYKRYETIQAAHLALATANVALRKTLSELTGEALPENPRLPVNDSD